LEVREVEIVHEGKRYILRPPLKRVAGKMFGAVAVPPVWEVRGAKGDSQLP